MKQSESAFEMKPEIASARLQDVVKPKKSLMARFRCKKEKPQGRDVQFQSRPAQEATRDAEPQEHSLTKEKSFPIQVETILDKAPTAREAAFGGPPRYDWIDIETVATIKIQAAFRRHKVMRELERAGLSTAAIRNASRRRQALKVGPTTDVPSIFHCCALGLAFGDASQDDDFEEHRRNENEMYEQRKKEREEREAQLRSQYLATQREPVMEEAYEVIEGDVAVQ